MSSYAYLEERIERCPDQERVALRVVIQRANCDERFGTLLLPSPHPPTEKISK